MNRGVLLLCLLSATAISFTQCQSGGAAEQADPAYRAEIENWREERISRLTAPDGWLSLAGLFYLSEGDNRFGSAAENDLVFPASAPGRLGKIALYGDSLLLVAEPGRSIQLNDSVVGRAPLQVHTASSPALMQYGSLSWFIIERGGRYLVRLRDRENQAISDFTGIDYFPVDASWRLAAQFIPHEQPETLRLRNVLDMELDYTTEGVLQFEQSGRSYQLSVLDGGENDFFIIFADPTNGAETYAAGRYLYAPRPDDSGNTLIDFNKAYNPPCVFTDYATCLLPPAENRLPIPVRAGEMSDHH